MKTFKEVADELNKRCQHGVSAKRQHTWLIEKLKPIHPVSIEDIDAPALFQVLQAIGESTQTARRAKMLTGRVVRYAIVKGYRKSRDFTSDMRGVLLKADAPKARAAVTDPAAVEALLQAIERLDGSQVVRTALRVAPHVFVRPSELRMMEWTEIDFIQGIWTIPAGKTKMRREHVVPLTKVVSDILWRECERGPSLYVFPGRDGLSPISENMLSLGLRRAMYGPDEMSVHGFRALASTLLRENGFDSELIELQLAHLIGSSTRRAYDRAARLEDRRAMMNWWSDYLVTLLGADPLQEAA